jgi:hypothetical protein
VHNQILLWFFYVFAGLGLVMFVIALWSWPRGEHCRCPGMKAKLLWRGRCWYNLQGQVSQKHDVIRCPECGTQMPLKKLVRDGRRFRIGRVALLLFVIGVGSGIRLTQKTGSWTKVVPTVPLVILAKTPIAKHHTPLRDELKKRVNAKKVKRWAGRTLASTLAKDLRHDNVRWNAWDARRMLHNMWPECKEAVEYELVHGGRQSQILAAQVLRNKGAAPSVELIKACITDLHDDYGEPDWFLRMRNAKEAAAYLEKWWSESEPYVREVLQSEDSQQRVLAAVIVGFAGSTQDMEIAVPELLPHLYDNNRVGDATYATPALYGFGPEVIPMLLAELAVADRQAHGIILHIIERFEHPERHYSICNNLLPRISYSVTDPVTTSIEMALSHF